MIRVASDQPTFLPWAGFWHKALSVDLMIYSVGVPVSYGRKDHYHNRVRLAGSWLTMPILSHTHGVPFKDLTFDPRAQPKLARSIRTAIGKKFPHHARAHRIADRLETYRGSPFLADLNRTLLIETAVQMGADHYAQEIDEALPDPVLCKTARLIARIRRFTSGPVEYYMGRGALDYMDIDLMHHYDIRVMVQVLSPEVRDESVTQLIAKCAAPVEVILGLGHWEELR